MADIVMDNMELVYELRKKLEAAEGKVATARIDTLLLMWHADDHANPNCKRCAEWFDELYPAARDTAGRARAAQAKKELDD